MIYITGDTHGQTDRFECFEAEGESNWGKDDYLIVCGDFGYIWDGSDDEKAFLDKLSEKPYTIAFVDGNHENFPEIYSYPTEEWKGGVIGRIRPNIIHLRRGQVYDICGKTFFTMGGAASVDRMFRKEGYSWWKEELPTNDEYRTATASLEAHGNKVDYVITHTAPRELVSTVEARFYSMDEELTGFFDWIYHEIEFKDWFCGHLHIDRRLMPNFRMLFFDVEKIEV